MKKNHKKHISKLTMESPQSVAALASGMADDFNNILTTVMGACSLIDMDDPENSELHQYVSLIRASAEHAAALSVSLMHASSEKHEGCHSGSQRKNSISVAGSVRDKKNSDDIVSSNNHPGGLPA